MALPRFLYDDPSKHVDFVRKERAKYEANQKHNKAEKAKDGLERLFKNGAASNEQK